MDELAYTPKEIENLIFDEVPKCTFFIHYTGVEVAEKLLKTGKIPTDKPFYPKPEAIDKLYIFSCHSDNSVRNFFRGFKIFYNKFDKYCKGVGVKSYAVLNALHSYIIENELKVDFDGDDYELISYISDKICSEEWGGEEPENMDNILRRDNNDLYKHYDELKKRRGVAMFFDKSILELKPIKDPMEDFSLFVDCPGGLDKKYVKGIVPLGNREKEILLEYTKE